MKVTAAFHTFANTSKKVKVKVTLQHATKAQTESRIIDILFL